MTQRIGYIALLVPDYDSAIAYFTKVLGFTLVDDTPLNEAESEKRWVSVAPPGSTETQLRLMKAKTPEQVARIGDQTGGRVFLFLHTDDFWRDYEMYKARGVDFTETEPRKEAYGTVIVFRDCLGNLWDLIELSPDYKETLPA